MNKLAKRILFVVIAGVILFLILQPKLWPDLYTASAQEPQAGGGPGAGGPPPALPVDGVLATPGPVENRIVVTGSVLANETVELSPEVAGKVTGIFFEEGQRVKEGDLLLTLNDEELKAELQKEKYTKKLREDIESRQRQLLQREAISQEEYDNALTELNTTNAQIQIIEARLDKTRITAPFDGVAGLRQVSPGSFISPSDPITRIYNLNPAKLEFSIPGKYASEIKAGRRINFTVDGITGNFQGTVYAVEPRVDPRTRTLNLRAYAENPEDQLLPGQFARIELVLAEIEDAIMVPTVAVIPELNGHKIFVLKEGVVASLQVEVGMRTESEIEITEGLIPTDTVITTGLLQIRPGMAVQVNLTE